VQGLAIHAAQAAPGEPIARGIVAESSFRASRDGLEAGIWDGGVVRPARDLARDAVVLARPGAREQGSEDALEEIERIVRDGNGADRQRSAHARGGMDGLLERLVAETEAPLR
jgi:carboxylate-amine ligase